MWHFCIWSVSGAEMSKTLRHWCRSVLDFYGGTEVSIGHFGTSAEISWVRSVLGPKCPYTFRNFKYIVSNTYRMLLLELLSRLQNSNTSLLFWNLFTGLVSERIEYKIISLTYKILNTTQPSYLYDLVSIQPPHGHNTRSSPYVTPIKPSSSLKDTHRSFRHSPDLFAHQFYVLVLIFGTSFLHHSEFLIQITHPPLSDLHLNMPV